MTNEAVQPATDEQLAEVRRRLTVFSNPSIDRDIVEALVSRVEAADRDRAACAAIARTEADDMRARSEKVLRRKGSGMQVACLRAMGDSAERIARAIERGAC